MRQTLEGLYEGYCRRQALALMQLVPREAVRGLYRQAHAWATRVDRVADKDPLATLVQYCRSILPLPPFPVWKEDFVANRAAHVDEVHGGVSSRPDAPVTVDVRPVKTGSVDWYAGLSVYPDGDVWRGFIAFQCQADATSVRTADIFRDRDPEHIRDRFRSFEPETLRAFLRSTLP